jgi:hypothetical protein
MSTKNKIQAVNNTPKKLHEIKNTLDGYKPLPEKSSKRADLFEIMYHYSDELNDDSTCYFGHAAVHFASKKMQAAEKYYAHKCDYTDGYADTALNGFVALIDTTTFGKGDEGFYITEKKIFGRRKELFSDEIKFEYNLADIKNIYATDKYISINGKNYEYSDVSEERLKIIINCISTYISQF